MVIGPLTEDSLQLLSTAIRWWTRREQFTFVNLPWTVPEQYSAATRPGDRRDVLTVHGAFVASGEQSFLQLWYEGRLPKTKTGYIGWTPCLRDEPLDGFHHFAFIKAELFRPVANEAIAMEEVWWLTRCQLALFRDLAYERGYMQPKLSVEQVADDQLDILLNGIEIGSYGVRRFEKLLYAYGTALALPRFTQALARS